MRFLERLRFPYLFLIGIILLAINAVVPDPILLVDEVLLAIGTLLLASLKKKTSKTELTSEQADTEIDADRSN